MRKCKKMPLPSVAKSTAWPVKLEDGQVEALGDLAQLKGLHRADTGIAWVVISSNLPDCVWIVPIQMDRFEFCGVTFRLAANR